MDFGIDSIRLPTQMVEPLARAAISEKLAEAKAIKAKGEFESSKFQAMTADILSKNKSSMQVQYLNFLKDLTQNMQGTDVILFPDSMMHMKS